MEVTPENIMISLDQITASFKQIDAISMCWDSVLFVFGVCVVCIILSLIWFLPLLTYVQRVSYTTNNG
jgi:hypothetical protein